MSAHFVTCDWGTTGWPMLSMTCEEPPESMCHAVWTCECEGWSSDGIDNGEPWHHHDEDLPPTDPDAELVAAIEKSVPIGSWDGREVLRRLRAEGFDVTHEATR